MILQKLCAPSSNESETIYFSVEIKAIGKSFCDGPFLPKSLAKKSCFMFEESFIPAAKLRKSKKCISPDLPYFEEEFVNVVAMSASDNLEDDFNICETCGELIFFSDSDHSHDVGSTIETEVYQ